MGETVLDKEGVFTFTIHLIASAIKSNETDFLFETTFGSNLLQFAEEVSGLSFQRMEEIVKEHYDEKALDASVLMESSETLTVSEIARRYKKSPSTVRKFLRNNNINYVGRPSGNVEEIELKLKKYEGYYTLSELSNLVGRNYSTVKQICERNNIEYRKGR